MFKIHESSSETNQFIFFDEFEEEQFDDFVKLVTDTLHINTNDRNEGPYSSIVTASYESSSITLTHGSYEGCFISLAKNDSLLAKKIASIFRKKSASSID